MNKIGAIAIISLIFIAFGCREKSAPKPIAYPFIENSVSGYTPHGIKSFPLQFEVANSATVECNENNNGWININYPSYNATIYCTYISTDNNRLQKEIAKNRELVYVHAKLASEISTFSYSDSTNNKWAELYILEGNVATPMQFITTDNSSYLFRGSLYFNSQVNNDSVAPIVEYLKNDISHIIETITNQ